MDTNEDMIGRTSSLLRAVSSHEPSGASTSALAGDTALPRPTVHRLLTRLASEGLIERDAASHQWVLGPELYLLGRTASQRYDVTELARPFVRRLAEVTGESAFFSVRQGDETVCLLREDGSFPIRSHVLYEGIRFPLGVASAGLAVLAYMPTGEVDDFLNRIHLTNDYGDEHAAPQIRERLDETRGRGWALNAGHVVLGSWGMGAAVFDSLDRPRWALTLTGIEQRFTDERQREYGRYLLREAHQLSRRVQQRGE